MPRRPIKPKNEEEVFAAEGTGVSPAEVEEREETKVVAESVELLREVGKRAPRLFGIPSGVDGLDDLFFTTEIRDGKPTKKPLGGFPSYAVVNITGVPDTGKSLMVEQFAIKQANLGYPVLFVTIESPAPFVAAGLRARAQAMGVDYEAVQDKIVLVDAASYGILRHSLPTLLNTLAHAIKTYNTKSLVVDSVTGLYEAREVMARDVVRTLFNFAKKWRQTALFVSQNMMVAHATTSVSRSHAFLLCWALLHKSVTKAVLSPLASSFVQTPTPSPF
jgi:KaiC domain protein